MRFDQNLNPIQRTTMTLFSTLRIALLRVARGPWLLAVVAIGVIAIDILACTVPLYLKLIATSQLQTAIAQAPASARNMLIYAHSDASNPALQQRVAQEVETRARQDLGTFSATKPFTYLTSDHMTILQAGSSTASILSQVQHTQLDVFDYNAMLPHMRLVAGSLPQTLPAPATTPTGQPASTPVVITQEMAYTFNLQVGQRISIAYFGNNFYGDIFMTGKQAAATAVVAGIWKPTGVDDPFWNGFSFTSVPYTIKYPHQAYPPPLWPLLTTQANFDAMMKQFPHVGVTQNWVYYADPTRITNSNSAAVTANIMALRTYLSGNLVNGNQGVSSNAVQIGTTGRLDQLITGAQQQLNLLALPLYMIAIQIIALAVLFVAAMARLLVTAQEQEIVTLKSRGASSPQVLGVFTAQSVPPGMLATVSGPLLAVGLSLLLVRWFLPGSAPDLTSLTNLTSISNLSHPFQVITPAIAGSVIGIVVVISSGLSVARLDVLAFRRELARPTHVPFWQRYYLDLGLAIVCVIGYLELSQFGTTQARSQLTTLNTMTTQTQTQSSGASPLLLVAPALLLLAGGLLLLRLVPLVARVGARLAERWRGLPALLALAHIERTPTRYARMILLLALAVGLGLFALTFDASLAQNTQDRIAYATGGDIRLETFATVGGQEASAYSQRLRTLPGVAAVTSVYRASGSVQAGKQQLQTTDVLGVDASTFAGVVESASWRPDFAAQSLPMLMAQLRAHQQGTDAGSPAHPLWTIVSKTLSERLHARVGDRFQVTLSDIAYTTTTAVVGAVVSEFPTLYPNNAPGGFIIFNARDLNTAIVANALPGTVVGANEFWLRTADDLANDRKLIQTLDTQRFHFSVTGAQSSRDELAQAATNPVNGGMRGLLLLGALAAALLAVLGSVTQAVVAARQRTRQFAVLRTLGMGARQLVGTLLSEQLVVYLFGLLGGTLLGLILMTATVPYLQFSDALIDPSTIGVPSYLLRVNWMTTAAFYGALLLAFVLALSITARFAARLGLGKTLRIGED